MAGQEPAIILCSQDRSDRNELLTGLGADVSENSPRAVQLEYAVLRGLGRIPAVGGWRTKVPSKIKTVLCALLFFGCASSVLAGTNPGNDYLGLVAARRAVPVAVSTDRIRVLIRTVKPVIAEEKAWLVPPRPAVVLGAPLCHGIAGSTMVWIKLTEPGGGMIHINVEQITSIRSDTQVLGANAQLDLTSGKFQGVRENVDQVMQMITAAAGARANGECA
jgi:hypothetical protein